MANLEITLKRSLIGRKKNQVETAKALGLTKTYKTVVKPDNDSIRGMISVISHLVEVKEA
ncbi:MULTISPECIES: 50S ribosomal protein L30 [Facklamia]|uniref:Large ribosomal subunit protein uL30 n=2 Tax=Facklamia hominis TaxID=178214 RepID=K1LEE8_9LACT|nr:MULTISPECIES: 50S ribosomal protein L30 [Facklamia]EKB55010.1 ribosomal protein L30 [Facklamia hominis CCUG 36813]EPH08752.1 ribosomal protein L30 [Facklamia hominis ACS-120-V-Sch10]MDK7187732.1 50S ribosomal protein L30 [Facklamia hominis]OFL67519.1 50S ribosomal protein L30 [Facklamia sp. HMSC062C11]PKY93609.1 50S ribosomal protein L30 [Facklamia hominis]